MPAQKMKEQDRVKITPSEAVELGATDSLFYSRFFFPRAARQGSPAFHQKIWNCLEHPANRHIGIKVFRGGAKTTLLRIFASKRVSYGLSRTILYVGKSQDHAARSVEWLLKALQFNKLWANTFQLRQGGKWTGSEIEVFHGLDDVPIRILAMGITGSIRGINIDDYRPDLIIGDDIIDEETAGSSIQRQKTEDLWFGALYDSLAPRSESPHAKQILLGTPIDAHDVNELCQQDPSWTSLAFSCFDENGESIWPERWSTQELMEEKQGFINRNQLSIWLREREVTLVNAESSTFRGEWLKYWEVLPDQMIVTMAIDPVPPPSDRELAMDLREKDQECIAVVGRYKGMVFLLEYAVHTGHSPDWTIAEFFRLAQKWKVRKCRVESVAYQRTLKWLLEKAMMERAYYVQLDEPKDRRPKPQRIADGLTGVSSNGNFYVLPQHVEFIDQYTRYPKVKHDDVLEAVAMATTAALEEDTLEMIFNAEDEVYEALPEWREAP